jgi:hypothetical protein
MNGWVRPLSLGETLSLQHLRPPSRVFFSPKRIGAAPCEGRVLASSLPGTTTHGHGVDYKAMSRKLKKAKCWP